MALPQLKNAMEEVKKQEESAFFEVGVEKTDLGRPDSLRFNILTWVLNERYDRAIDELKDFLEGPSEYPNFKEKISRYVRHSIDLIYAIKAKRGFPGISSLTRAKQQELREKFKDHFRELQHILRIIENIHADLRIQDVRSTVYVVRALWLAGFAIVSLAFILDMRNGVARTALVYLDQTFEQAANWLAAFFGL